MININNLYKNFGNLQVLKGVSLSVKPQEKVVIIGSSGSGKSTLLRCINLLEKPNSGDIYFYDDNITNSKMNVNEYRSKVGMVFQSFNLFNNIATHISAKSFRNCYCSVFVLEVFQNSSNGTTNCKT